jgi:hypothetical protein
MMIIMIRGFANYILNELCSFGPRIANILRRMVVLPEAAYSKIPYRKYYALEYTYYLI